MHLFSHSRRSRRAFRGAVAILLAVGLAAGTQTSASAATGVSISIGNTTLGSSLFSDTQGLSIEVQNVTQPQFASGNFAQYLRTLGGGTLRVGGNTADKMFWTSTDEPTPAWAVGRIVPADLQRLAQVAGQSGWSVVLAVNLKHFNPTRAADEAFFAHAALGNSLVAVEIGNEPNFYYSDTTKFWNDFQTYVSAIRSAVPGTSIWGPDAVGGIGPATFQSDFVSHQVNSPTVAALSRHFYPLNACPGNTVTVSQMLSAGTYNFEKSSVDALASQATTAGAATAIDETNSAVCGGYAGVSDVFASALWALDFGLLSARQGARTVDFHSTVVQCGSPKPLFMVYSPYCAATAADATAGNVQARPEYYGLAAMRLVGSGSYLALTNSDTSNLRAYAVRSRRSLELVLINVRNPSGGTPPTAVSVQLGSNYFSAQVTTLKSSSGLSAKTGITLGGGTVQPDGTFTGTSPTSIPVNGSVLNTTVAPGSAAIINLR